MSVRDGVEEIDGQWFSRFVVGPTFTDTTDVEGNVTSAADNKAAYRASVDAAASSKYRDQRNKLLAASVWTQLADSSADASAWATYRTALRDLPTTDGWPHNITWPTEPS